MAAGTVVGGGVVDPTAAETGARASEIEGFKLLGGAGPGAGDTVETGVGILPDTVS